MQYKRVLIATVAASLALTVAVPLSASAANGTLDDEVAGALQQDLQALAAESSGTVTFSDVSVDVSPSLVKAAGSTDPDTIADYILDTAAAAPAKVSSRTRVSTLTASPNSLPGDGGGVPTKTVNYTADQSTPLPSVGIAWVNQDMKVTFTGNYIDKVVLTGDSYGTGISFFAYNHISTKLGYTQGRTCLNTTMKGTFSGIVKGSAVSFAASVLASDRPKGGKMVDELYYNCK